MLAKKQKFFYSSVLLCCLLLVGGCASKDTQVSYTDSADPWESANRKVFAFNDAVDSVTLEPVAEVYKKAPSFIRYRISNFFSNIGDISNTANSLLQGKVSDAANDFTRILVNTTFGILGFFDVASSMGLDKHEEDLGQTLAAWGVGRGPYIVLPLLGPTTLRNLPTRILDYVAWPYITNDSSTQGLLQVVNTIDIRSSYIDKEAAVRELSPDFYSAVKSFYLARRENMIMDNNNPNESDDLYDEI